LLLPLFHPIVDVTNWQRIAAFAKDAGNLEPSQRSAAFRGILRIYAIETPLMSLFMCMFAVIAVVSMATPGGMDAVQDFLRQLAAEQNVMAGAALSLLLVSVFAIALSTMSSLFSASLCTIHYDLLPAFWPELAWVKPQPALEETRRTVIGTGGLCLVTTIAGFLIAHAYLRVNSTSSEFLALLFAFCCAQLSFAPLVLGPLIARTSRGDGTVSSGWALAILASGAAVGPIAIAVYFTTGSEPWLWAAVPACLASGLLLFTMARLWSARTSAT
jgi:Na+/proline symporter